MQAQFDSGISSRAAYFQGHKAFNRYNCLHLVIHTQVRYRVQGFIKQKVLCCEGNTKEMEGFL